MTTYTHEEMLKLEERQQRADDQAEREQAKRYNIMSQPHWGVFHEDIDGSEKYSVSLTKQDLIETIKFSAMRGNYRDYLLFEVTPHKVSVSISMVVDDE